MGAAEKLEPNEISYIKPGRWVYKKVIQSMYGFTEDQLKKYRSGMWLEGKHFKKNPANAIVYAPAEIDNWMEGKH